MSRYCTRLTEQFRISLSMLTLLYSSEILSAILMQPTIPRSHFTLGVRHYLAVRFLLTEELNIFFPELPQKLAVVDHPELEHTFEEYAINHCCGDHVLSRVMDKVGVGLTYECGRLQGEPWDGIRWDDRTWCSEILSFHHVGQGHVQELWEFERLMEQKLAKDKKNGGYILTQISWNRHRTISQTINGMRWLSIRFQQGESTLGKESDVDKIEDENKRNKWRDYLRFSNTEKAAIGDRNKCAQACMEREKCLQWKWVKGKCVLNDSVIFKFKDPNPKGESEAWWSGWMLDWIDEVRGRMKCERGLEAVSLWKRGERRRLLDSVKV
ncbi:hypothetical protein BDZ91DRAFT_830176 [Kalaharituber pfeilii]|nr:hypothetical protein BDZ91DRAFT_830176 [Kalaharituber pfeilii]